MKKTFLKILPFCIFFIFSSAFAFLSSTTCGSAAGRTYTSWTDANAARATTYGSCSGGDGYIQPGYNPVTGYPNSGTSSWNCTGTTDGGLTYPVTANCSLTVTIPATTTTTTGGTTTPTVTTTPTSSATCHIEQGTTMPTNCTGVNTGGLCLGNNYQDITFATPFTSLPAVIVAARRVSDQAGCVGYATDTVKCFPQNITNTGFRMICEGSPYPYIGYSCGPIYEGHSTYASGTWMALEDTPTSTSCRTMSNHLITPTYCTGTNVGGLCSGRYTQDITFPTPYTTIPHVLVAPEITSNQGGCVGATTDQVYCMPGNISTTGFTLTCTGSPISVPYDACGTPYSNWSSLAAGGYIAKESTSTCQIESGHNIQTLGSAGFIKNVTFTKTYDVPPNVIVSPELVTAAGYGFATDSLACYATNVTTTGFTAVCWGSPINSYPDGAGQTVAQFGYMVIDSSCCSDGYIPDGAGSCRLPICLANTSISVNTPDTAPANSYALTADELPPSLKLTQDYTTTLRWSILPTQYTLAEINRTGTADGCEYTCNDGYIPDTSSGVGTDPAVSASSTSTNPNFKVTKLLAKAVAGVCPTNSSAYVPNLTGVVATDKICVRLVYDNATTGAISNALITDSIPTGFTRVTNSTKNCLTPSGASELCSDASGMGGAIGDNGWSGNNFSLTPHAGFYAIPTTQTTASTMEMGRVPFLTMTHCNWFQSGAGALDSTFLNYFYTATTGTEGIVTTDNYCYLNPVGGYTLGSGNGNHTRSLLGYKNYHYYYCNYGDYSSGNSKIVLNSTIPSNSTTNPFTASQACTSDPSYIMTPTPVYNEMLGQRYLYHSVCRYYQSAPTLQWDVYYRSNISFGNTTPSAYCPWQSGYYMNSAYVSPVDLLDTANGKGYIQYMVEATSTPANTVLPNVTLAGTITGNTTPDSGISNATINSTNSCTTSASDTSLVLGGNNVAPAGSADCPGTYDSRGLCTTAWKIRVNFSEPFLVPPSVVVAPEKISDIADCVNYKTDKVVAYAENISSTGFDLRVYGSPVTGSCGTYWDGYGTRSTAGWIAIGKRATSTPQKIVAQSGHDIALGSTSGECLGTYSSSSGGTCSTLWTKHVTFTTPFNTVPKVVVSGENVSTASGSVSGATDGYRFYPENITTTGFDIRGGGSWGGYILPSKVGYLALGEVVPANEATSVIITKALTGTFTSYDGVCHGTRSGSLCIGYWDESITFSSSFTSTPHMFASPKQSSDTSAGSCVGGATDKIYNTATNITNLGFLATTHGSPTTGSCGISGGYNWDSGASLATMNWIALGGELGGTTTCVGGGCRLPVCLVNSAIGVTADDQAPANASPLTPDELPSSLKLVRDYQTTLIADPTRRTELALPEGCQYSCNDGYKIGPKTAVAESNMAGTFAKITDGGAGYTAAPTVTVTGGTCTTRPTATATINTSGSVNSLTLFGAVNCTVAPVLTLSAPTDTINRCVAIQCLGFAPPSNGIYCTDDTILAGHADQLNTHRSDSSQCTSNAKCEWFCPADNPYFCEQTNNCVRTQNDCGTPNLCPSNTTYIAGSTKADKCCTAQEVTNNTSSCGATNIICNNDAVCDATEGCLCPDCKALTNPTNNTTNPVDHCATGNVCTSSTSCPSTSMCCPVGSTWDCTTNQCSTTTTCHTSAPSELKALVDYPLIQCNATNATDTHFRYKITKTGGTAADTYTSPLFTVGTSVTHPTTFNTGTYTVTCLYGTSANTNAALTDYGMTAATCTKTMTVNATAQGCSRLYPYRGATLSDSLSSDSAFDASFRCGSRNPTTPLTETKAYRLQIGTTDPAWLLYDQNISDLFNGLAIGPVSTQTQNYSFTSGTDVSCAVKVGDGYSTNTSCQARTCVGGSCANPQSFIVVPSDEASCTNGPSVTYDIGCNPSSPDYTSCLQTFFETASGTTSYIVQITVDGHQEPRTFNCSITTPPGALGPVKSCTIDLPSGGMPVTVLAGDVSASGAYSFQTTAYTLAKDTGKPTGTISYYTNYSNGVILAADQYEYWQKQPITAVVTCSDKTTAGTEGKLDGSGCACSQTLQGDATELQYWSQGVPDTDTNIGPDIMKYSRVMTNNSGALSPVRVMDTANNISLESFAPDFGVDSTPPKLTASTSGSTVTLTFTDNDIGASGFWKPLSAFGDTLPTGVLKGTTTSSNAIVYRIGPKTNLAALEFGADCSPLPVKNTNYFKYKETPAPSTTQTLTLTSFDTANNVVAYCTEDNAGNINRGYYPNQVTGCFASTNMATIPTLSPPTLATHYAPLLKNRLISTTLTDNQKYGYSFSENSTDAGCFRGILANNITTLIANQLNPKTTTTLSNWTTDVATIKNTTTANTNGYYYYSYTSNTNNTLSISTSPTGTGTKSVVVEGGNIQINTNIEYTGTGKTLLLVARKNTNGQGGNIYINPSVTRIDAIIIADGGAVMNGTTTGGVTDTKEWTTASDVTLLTNRLTINGRIYSYNTRGGSLIPQVSPGTDFDPITGNTGKYFDANVFHNNGTLTQAASYDLERLRVMLTDGNSQCTTHVNYQTFTTTNLPALLLRPSGYAGGNCGF